jgi:lipopolysaccharide transport system ATP-binding protein
LVNEYTVLPEVKLSVSEVAIAVENLSKRYFIKHTAAGEGRSRYTALRDVMGHELLCIARKVIARARRRNAPRDGEIEEFWALKDVNFEVKRGEVLGIIGRNGAGKSTLLKILSRITEPTEGRIQLRGRVGSLLEVGTGFHPELTGRENIFLNGAIFGMARREIIKKFDEIVDFAGVEPFLETPVKHYSSGMYARLAFAVAAHLEPDILVVDEVLAVGDAQFQQKCLGKMDEVSRREGKTVLFVSHNMGVIQKLCPTSIWLDRGSIRQYGSTDTVIKGYLSQGTLNRDRVVGLEKLPRPHFGGNEFRLIAVEWLCDLPLHHGEKVKTRILFQTRTPVENVAISLGICDIGGTQILTYDSDLCDLYRPKLPREGVYAVDFEIDALPLHPDTYSLDIYCGARGVGGRFDFVPASLQFEVLPGSRTPDFLCSDHWPSVHLKGRWEWDLSSSEPGPLIPAPAVGGKAPTRTEAGHSDRITVRTD